MRLVIFVFTCLACACHGRRVQGANISPSVLPLRPPGSRPASLPPGDRTVAERLRANKVTLIALLLRSQKVAEPLKRLLLSTAAWLQRQRRPLSLPVAFVILLHTRARGKKKVKMREIRRQVCLNKGYRIAIVTTAAMPWMTGTAVNPLLRAVYLAKAGKHVTLMVPWLHPLEQQRIFPNGLRFESPAEQETHIRNWLQQHGGMSADFKFIFYPSRYDTERGSLLPLGDITRFFEKDECDICVLEEPEHLNWYYHGPNWRHRFKRVVGIVHTNYDFYAKTWRKGGGLTAALLRQINWWMCQGYCDNVIKLSDTIQPLPRAIVCNVHGVRADFLAIGRPARFSTQRFSKGAYFLGKTLWAKGHGLLFDYLSLQRDRGDPLTHIDIYGKGEDLEEVKAEAAKRKLDVTFYGPTDHAGPAIRDYKVFVNPSRSEVLATTIAEALAMGKFVVIQRHPSNEFFKRFRNALMYDTAEEFLQQLEHALNSEPEPLSTEEQRALSWEGATDRFLEKMIDSTLDDRLYSFEDHLVQWVHQGMQSCGPLSDFFRMLSGASTASRQYWMHSRRYRDAPVEEIAEVSVQKSPPLPVAAA